MSHACTRLSLSLSARGEIQVQCRCSVTSHRSSSPIRSSGHSASPCIIVGSSPSDRTIILCACGVVGHTVSSLAIAPSCRLECYLQDSSC
jgi:hypothetical protein